jgi:HPt (histidine-containing phosphotransfer) domain-containing protein
MVTPTHDPASPPIDIKTLHELEDTIAAGMPELMVELFDSYLEDAPKHLANLNAAVDRNDAPAVQFAAHTLKSASGTFGATQLAGLCQQMEDQAKSGQIGDFPQLCHAIESEFDRVRAALLAEKQTRMV